MKNTNLSIRTKLVVLMIGLVSGAIIICIALNSFFLKRHYTRMRLSDLVRAYDTIEDALNETRGYIDDAGIRRFTKTCERLGVTLLIADPSLDRVYMYGEYTKHLTERLKDVIFNSNAGSGTDYIITDIIERNDKYTLQKIHDNFIDADYYEMSGTFAENNFFLMRLTVENVSGVVKEINMFFAFVGTIVIIVSTIIVSAVAYKIAKRIVILAKLADRMAHMDFSAGYNGKCAGDEIDVLGRSMNVLSGELDKNMTELKAANIELMKDIKEKTEAEERRTEFLSNVSHELKTPLAIIQGYAEGLKESVNEDDQSREFYCDVIIDEASKMNLLVKRLLTLNHLENGFDNLTIERFNITEVIEQRLNAAAILIEQKNANVIFNKNDALCVWADEFLIEEVITNYISNALNHLTGEKVIKITVEFSNVENSISSGGKVKVTVFNSGNHIPESDIEHIWEKFYKVDKARSREYGGNGIGLSIVKAVMDAHKQAYGVLNVNGGVAFWFELDGINCREIC